MTEKEIEMILREYLKFASENHRPFLGEKVRYFLETEELWNGYWKGRIREEIGYIPGSACKPILMDAVSWTFLRGRKDLLEDLLKEFSGGKSPEEASLELTSSGRSGIFESWT